MSSCSDGVCQQEAKEVTEYRGEPYDIKKHYIICHLCYIILFLIDILISFSIFSKSDPSSPTRKKKAFEMKKRKYRIDRLGESCEKYAQMHLNVVQSDSKAVTGRARIFVKKSKSTTIIIVDRQRAPQQAMSYCQIKFHVNNTKTDDFSSLIADCSGV